MNKVKKLYQACGWFLATIIILLLVALMAGLIIGTFCLEGWVFMLLWNWVAVELFNTPILSYWVCVGVVIFITFIGRLFSGFKISAKLD